jgi:mRNA interferase RelE/StbE
VAQARQGGFPALGGSEKGFEVRIDLDAQKELKRLPPPMRERVVTAIETLKDNPFTGKDVVKLKGELAGLYRLRVGTYRVVYSVDEERQVITVEAIGTRSEVY